MLMFARFATMSNPDKEYDLSRARRVGSIIRHYREDAGLRQEDLLAELGMSSDNRAWVREVERGMRYRGNDVPVILKPTQYVKIAVAIGADPAELLTAARIDPKDWPETTRIRGIYTPTIDASGLTERQIRIMEELTTTLRESNRASAPHDQDGGNEEHPQP